MSLEDLIARATAGQKPINKCWATTLEGDARLFVETLEELEAQNPGTVNRNQTRLILDEQFGIVLSRETVRNHFIRNCRCGR